MAGTRCPEHGGGTFAEDSHRALAHHVVAQMFQWPGGEPPANGSV